MEKLRTIELRGRTVRALLIAVLASASLGADCSNGEPEVSVKDKSLRILTYNIQFVTDGDNVSDSIWKNDWERAEFLAEKMVDTIQIHDADVIAFNEAFNIEPQVELSEKLCAHYPYFTRYIDEAADDQHQDSGLMVFSRHKFVNLGLANPAFYSQDHLAFTQCVQEPADDSNPAYWDDIGFSLFPSDSCFHPDCLANKGVALARFEHSQAGDIFNIVFTHLQANDDEDDDFEGARQKQMERVELLIRSIYDFEQQRTFVIGDLNINGAGCSHAGCVINGVGGEWFHHFGSGGFFGCGSGDCTAGDAYFIDSWGFEMPKEDWGRTQLGPWGTDPDETQGERLDYILHNVPAQRLMCMQHMRLLHYFADNGGNQIADHLPVLAEFNLRAPLCSPLEAKVVTGGDFNHEGVITYPRSVQWLTIKEKGTYSIFVPNHMQFEVYAATDMSEPISDYHGEQTDWGIVYKLPEPPYYIKLFATEKMWTGHYFMWIHEHQCGRFDCCALTPGDVDGYPVSWAEGNLDSASRWFCFHTDLSHGGGSPTLTFVQDGICNSGLAMTLLTEDDSEIEWNGYVIGQVATDATATVSRLERGKYFVEMFKTNQDPLGFCTATLEFYTTLTYFYPRILFCDDETGASGTAEEIGHDEIWYHLGHDGGCTGIEVCSVFSHLYDFDEDDAKNFVLEELGPTRYIDCVVMNLLEEDDMSSCDVTFLQSTPIIDTLALDEMESLAASVWQQGDYTYVMKYRLTHEPLDPPSASP